MKKLILSATAVLFSIGAFAQNQELGYGIKAGVNLPNYHFSEGENNTESTTNFHVTAYMDAPISQNFSIQPGVSLQGKGAKLDGSFGTLTQNTMWVEVPVNAVVKFPTGYAGNFFIGAGPYAAFGISGQNKWDTVLGEGEEDFDFGSDGIPYLTQKGTDFGVNFMAGYQLSSGLTLGAGYGLGLANIGAENINGKQTNRVLSFSVGFAL